MTKILITGAAGHVGSVLTQRLTGSQHEVIATDIREPANPVKRVPFEILDIRGTADCDGTIARHKPDTVVHLASIVTPPPKASRDFLYQVDVGGTENILNACLKHGVRRLVVTSSGAAYGYHPENSRPLVESDPIRGNKEFAYSYHKRLVEEMLAQARVDHPELEQVVLRVGTVLGEGLENQITSLFHKPRLLALTGYDSPFVFIWTEDLATILERAATEGPSGTFNVAGDGALSVKQLAAMMGKRVRSLPPWLIRSALSVAKPLKLSQFGPEQVKFLQYRPVLDNRALKEDFGYVPQKTSREVFGISGKPGTAFKLRYAPDQKHRQHQSQRPQGGKHKSSRRRLNFHNSSGQRHPARRRQQMKRSKPRKRFQQIVTFNRRFYQTIVGHQVNQTQCRDRDHPKKQPNKRGVIRRKPDQTQTGHYDRDEDVDADNKISAVLPIHHNTDCRTCHDIRHHGDNHHLPDAAHIIADQQSRPAQAGQKNNPSPQGLTSSYQKTLRAQVGQTCGYG